MVIESPSPEVRTRSCSCLDGHKFLCLIQGESAGDVPESSSSVAGGVELAGDVGAVITTQGIVVDTAVVHSDAERVVQSFILASHCH